MQWLCGLYFLIVGLSYNDSLYVLLQKLNPTIKDMATTFLSSIKLLPWLSWYCPSRAGISDYSTVVSFDLRCGSVALCIISIMAVFDGAGCGNDFIIYCTWFTNTMCVKVSLFLQTSTTRLHMYKTLLYTSLTLSHYYSIVNPRGKVHVPKLHYLCIVVISTYLIITSTPLHIHLITHT